MSQSASSETNGLVWSAGAVEGSQSSDKMTAVPRLELLLLAQALQFDAPMPGEVEFR